MTVANALGSGLLETSAFMPFFPGLCKRLLGEDLKLPTTATWWCGQPEALRYVLDNLDFLVIKPAFPSTAREPVFGGKLDPDQRALLIAQYPREPARIRGARIVKPIRRAGVVGKTWAHSAAGCAPRISGGARRFLGGDPGWIGAGFAVDRYPGGLDATGRRQQRHLGALRRPGEYIQFAAAA